MESPRTPTAPSTPFEALVSDAPVPPILILCFNVYTPETRAISYTKRSAVFVKTRGNAQQRNGEFSTLTCSAYSLKNSSLPLSDSNAPIDALLSLCFVPDCLNSSVDALKPLA